VGLGALAAALSAGCVASDLRAMERARERYEACVAASGESDPECRALRESYLAAQERYESNSRRAWSCDPATEECPTPR
jgi:hypothetical protein